MLDPVFDQILELFHLDLNDNLVHVRVVAIAVAFLVEVAGQAVRIVSRHPVRRVVLLLFVEVLSEGIFESGAHIRTSCSLQVELRDASWRPWCLLDIVSLVHPLLLRLNHQEFVHDADQCLYHEPMVVVLELALMILAMHKQVLEQILEQLHSESFMVQIGVLGECLFEDAKQG